ncbi:MAG: PilZ domain-containing protein [Phycisphaeraceae bacterium]|nr:MAG: PilZ domain-containing protein [Phycisphaeraceae bacterium]
MQSNIDRRLHTRYSLPAMYWAVKVRPLDSDEFLWEGHAYDISVGGVRFELDRGIEPGTPVAMQIEPPHAAVAGTTERRAVFVFANVVWLEDEDEPGPVRMAAVFSRFARTGDEELLKTKLFNGWFAQAA